MFVWMVSIECMSFLLRTDRMEFVDFFGKFGDDVGFMP